MRLEINSQDNLILNFQIEKAMSKDLFDILDSGLPIKFTYWIKIKRPRELLRDEILLDRTLIRVLEKDNLKNRYRVAIEGDSPRDYAKIEEAIAIMSRVDGLDLFPVKTLEINPPIFLQIKAQLNKFKLPFRLHYLLTFVSYWDFETEWYTLELPINADALR